MSTENPNDLPAYMKFTITVDFQKLRMAIEQGTLAQVWENALKDIVKDSINIEGHEMTNKVVDNDDDASILQPRPDITMRGFYCKLCGNSFHVSQTPAMCPYCGSQPTNFLNLRSDTPRDE